MKKTMVKLMSIFIVLSMLCTAMCVTSFASSVSYEGEIFVDAGNAIYSHYARKAGVGYYTLSDGRTVPVYRLLRDKDTDYDATVDVSDVYDSDNAGHPAVNNERYRITVKVWAPESGNYSLETLSSKYNATAYSPYKIILNGTTELTSATYDANATITGSSTSQFAIHNWGTVALNAGENTLVLEPTKRTSTNTYSVGLGYVKLTPAPNDVTLMYTDASLTDHDALWYGTESADKVYDSNGTEIVMRRWRLYAANAYDTTIPYYVRYTFTAPVTGYYDISVHSGGASKYHSEYDIYVDNTLLLNVNDSTTGAEKIYYNSADTSTREESTTIVKWSLGKVWLEAGSHALKFEKIAKIDTKTTVAEGSGNSNDAGVHNFRFYKADFNYSGSTGEVYSDATATKSLTSLHLDSNNATYKVELADGTTVTPGHWRLTSTSTWTNENLAVTYTLNAPKAGKYNLEVYANGHDAALSDYTLKLNGATILTVNESTTAGEVIAADATNKKLVKFVFENVDLNEGANTLCFDEIQPKDGYESETATNKKHNLYFWKAVYGLSPATSGTEAKRGYFRVLSNVYGAYDSSKYSDYDLHVTGNVYTENNIDTAKDINVYLAEYDKTTLELKNVKAANIPVAANTDTAKTRMINYDVTASDFDISVDAATGAITFNSKVKLFVWDGISPIFESKEISE